MPRSFVPGLSEYRIWNGMKSRCHNPKDAQYRRYGKRGIFVAPKWKNSFLAFLEDMGPRPSARHTLERKNNDGPYSKTNCVWATYKQQARNKSNSRFIFFRKKKRLLVELAEENHIRPGTLRARLKAGWKIEQALSLSVRPKGKVIRFRGKEMTRNQWAKYLGVSESAIRIRFSRGWPISRILSTGPRHT